MQGVFSGTLRVGAITTAEYLLPPMLVTFANEHPQVKLKLQVGNRDEIVRMLASQDIDLAIMGRPPAELKTVSTAFAKHPMAFLAAPQHALMKEARRGRDAWRTSPSSASWCASAARARARPSSGCSRTPALPLRIGSELSSNEAIKHMCAAGFGVAFLSMHTCVLELDAGVLALLPMQDNPIERDWHVMHLASRQLPQVALAFEKFLVARAASRRSTASSATRPAAPRASGARAARARRPRPAAAP